MESHGEHTIRKIRIGDGGRCRKIANAAVREVPSMPLNDSMTVSAQPERQLIRKISAVGRVALLAQLALSGVLLVVRPNIVLTVVRHLGYPDYFPLGLGVAKLLALVVLAVPKSPRRLKEWAYAGATFDLLAATVSHIAVHDSITQCLGPLAVLIIVAAAYVNFSREGSDNEKRLHSLPLTVA
jgi:hypothetical protein